MATAPAAPASAHSQVISSSPADGQRVEKSPTQLTFVFSEPADVNTIVVSLTGPSGPLDVLGTPVEKAVNDLGHQTIVVPVTAELPAGLYRETISATSRIDGHSAGSELIFGVRTDVATPAGDSGNTTSAVDRVRSILQGIMLIAAGIAFGLIALAGPAGGRGLSAARIGAVVAAVAAIGSGAIWHTGNGLIVAAFGLIGSLILFAFFMISDPKSTPDHKWGRVLFSGLVALLTYFIKFRLYNPNALVLALFFLSPLTLFIDKLLPAQRFDWPTTQRRSNNYETSLDPKPIYSFLSNLGFLRILRR